MNLRVLGCEGGYDFDIANAIRYAAGLDNQSGVIVADPADIANMSLGGGSSSNTMANAIADARDAGLIIIAAAGNSSSSSASYPAAYEGVVSVSATSMADSLTNYSNYGSWVDVAAPGGQDGDLDGDGYQDLVLSTLARIEGGIIQPTFGGYQGTSMAAPHVAGVVALMKGIHPSLSPADLDAVIVSGNMTADLGAAGRDDNYGYGRIDALKTVGFANQLASGAPIPVTPILSFSNTYLNFGRLTQQVMVNVYNSGNGSLGVTSVAVSESRISVAAPASDDGLGNYAVSVDRSGLISGVYRGSVTFTSSVGERVVSVLYQVGSSGVTDEGDAGAVSILLYDVAAGETASFETVVSPINGEYQYRFSGPAGVYYVIAGSDLDNDGYICNPGEACGVYPLPDSPITLILNQNLSGVDFGVNFIIPSDAAGAASAVLKKPISRTKAPPQKGSF
jgi:serine protease